MGADIMTPMKEAAQPAGQKEKSLGVAAQVAPAGQKEKSRDIELIKKGNIAPGTNNHLDNLINMGQMAAIQVLIEHGTKLANKAAKIKGASKHTEVA